MLNDQAVLHQPFDIATHKRTFINYLEVIILEDGTVSYAVPSHQEKLISLACAQQGVSRGELSKRCFQEAVFEPMEWLCKLTNCIAVWNGHIIGEPNEQQKETLHTLREEKLYNGPIGEEEHTQLSQLYMQLNLREY